MATYMMWSLACGGTLQPGYIAFTRRDVKRMLAENLKTPWPELQHNGWRAVKVWVSEQR